MSDPKRHASLSDGSSQMRAIRTIIENIADTDATVLIRGESGVGKDLVARAIPSGLIESEFFGHEKGAFTGAHRRKPGQFEYADKGTIDLDEIGELRVPPRRERREEIPALVSGFSRSSMRSTADSGSSHLRR
jgi:transcriptional regulator with GAF, ATPase, and Fis domain